MSERTIYQIGKVDEPDNDTIWAQRGDDYLGVLVPVVRCKHGNIDPHYVTGPIDLPDTGKMCPGAGIGDNDE